MQSSSFVHTGNILNFILNSFLNSVKNLYQDLRLSLLLKFFSYLIEPVFVAGPFSLSVPGVSIYCTFKWNDSTDNEEVLTEYSFQSVVHCPVPHSYLGKTSQSPMTSPQTRPALTHESWKKCWVWTSNLNMREMENVVKILVACTPHTTQSPQQFVSASPSPNRYIETVKQACNLISRIPAAISWKLKQVCSMGSAGAVQRLRL